jgi:hypothetical protein
LNAVVPRSFLLSVQRVRARCSAQCAKSNLSALVPTSGNGTSSSRGCANSASKSSSTGGWLWGRC